MVKKTHVCSATDSSIQTPEPAVIPKIPIIGIGASAGGLEAFEQFFHNTPPDSGIAYILVPHLDPDHESMLADILGRVTKMPVVQAQDLMDIRPDNVYIIPPNREMSIFHQKIHLSIPGTGRGQQMKIDLFFRSLSEEQGDKAIGIILSGTGTDGTLGLRAIHGNGGISFVQDPKEAKYDGMPSSAINNGYATYILPVGEMPGQVIACVRSVFVPIPFRQVSSDEYPELDKNGATLRILRIIRSKTGHDFSQYKKSTIHRRISRRMAVHMIDDVATYVRYLEENSNEVQTLFRELLINVTSFFRDKEAFDYLKDDILPPLISQKEDYSTFRVWVAGCSTGEEAYSLAIIIREILDGIGKDCKVQIYSTDIAEDVIQVARKGFYPPNIVADVSLERLKKFFIREESGYQVKKDIREMVIFANQNVIKDPPFTRLDLLSCRNLLIYLETDLQVRLISTFHYALNPGGILFLSTSESIGSCPDLFKPLNRKWKIFEASGAQTGLNAVIHSPLSWGDSHPEQPVAGPVVRYVDTPIIELTKRALLQTYAPPSVVTDEDGNILYVHGDTGKFLRPAQGHATLSIIDMAREGLQLDLRTAIFTAKSKKIDVMSKNLQVRTNGGFESVDLMVRPVPGKDAIQGGLIISFLISKPSAPLADPEDEEISVRQSGSRARVEELEQELQFTRENLQATVEEMQAANEELKSTNEELQSTNEELQSTNEELETSREELQSVNEEVMTVNAELQAKIEQLTVMQNDMKNLLSSTGIGTVFLDIEYTIRRFTPEARKIYKLVPSDTGRPLTDIKSMIVNDTLIDDAHEVMDLLIPIEKEVQSIDNSWFLVRIMPYRTLDNVIDGIVLTFIDITSHKTAEEELKLAREYAESIVNTVREPLLVIGPDLLVVSANQSYYRIFHTSPSDVEGKEFTALGGGIWDIPDLILLLHSIISEISSVEDFTVNLSLPEEGKREVILNARAIPAKGLHSSLILLAIEQRHGFVSQHIPMDE